MKSEVEVADPCQAEHEVRRLSSAEDTTRPGEEVVWIPRRQRLGNLLGVQNRTLGDVDVVAELGIELKADMTGLGGTDWMSRQEIEFPSRDPLTAYH
jgi:hypothetical protein